MSSFQLFSYLYKYELKDFRSIMGIDHADTLSKGAIDDCSIAVIHRSVFVEDTAKRTEKAAKLREQAEQCQLIIFLDTDESKLRVVSDSGLKNPICWISTKDYILSHWHFIKKFLTNRSIEDWNLAYLLEPVFLSSLFILCQGYLLEHGYPKFLEVRGEDIQQMLQALKQREEKKTSDVEQWWKKPFAVEGKEALIAKITEEWEWQASELPAVVFDLINAIWDNQPFPQDMVEKACDKISERLEQSK